MAENPDEFKCTIDTKDGPVCGYIDRSDEGTLSYKFKGIPYGNPPLGHLRFLAPTPIKPWTDVKDCTKDTVSPDTYDFTKTCFIFGSEDCLYLDIFTPNIGEDKRLPVMFWIGCYAFTWNIDHIFDPTLLIEQNVIFVRCGFRLGPFGFLSVNDITAPGNTGLKDIVMALKWVQRNISRFGGDPKNVTLFGSSAGGALVHLMLLSPMATGLFHRAIIQSASALNNWSIDKNPSQSTLELAKVLGIKKTNKTEIVDELRSTPASVLIEACEKMMEMGTGEAKDIFDPLFKPCIEVEFEGQPAFITKRPPSLLKVGNFIKVPLIIGSNNIEGTILQFIKKDFYESYENYNTNTNLIVPKSLAADPKTTKAIGQELLKFYLGGEDQLREDTKTQYLQLVGDYYFLYYVNKTLRLHSQYAPECPIYYYILNYAGEWAVPSELNFFNTMGHSAEVSFLFRIKLPESPPCTGSRDSVVTRARMVKMWTNFAKYGNPTPDENDPLLQIRWDAVENPRKLNYLSIGSELTKGTNPFQERMAFWDNLHKEHTFLRALVYFNDLGVSW